MLLGGGDVHILVGTVKEGDGGDVDATNEASIRGSHFESRVTRRV